MTREVSTWFYLMLGVLAATAGFAACGGVKSGVVNIIDSAGSGGLASSSAGSSGSGGAGDSGDASAASCAARAPCANGTDQGVCNDGVCTACDDPKGDPACVAAYGDGNLCIAGACTKAQCRTSVDCSSGQSCVNNQCTACASDGDCTDPSTVCNVKTGACVSNASCGSAVNGAACPVNPNDLCCGTGGVCAAVACCGTDACKSSPSVTTNDGTCNTGQCVLNTCQTPTATTRYVQLGAPAGGSGSKACPFANLISAFDDLASTGGTVILKTNGKAVLNPLAVGSGIAIYGADSNFDACTRSTCPDPTTWAVLSTGNNKLFNFLTAGSRELHFLAIQGVGKDTSTTTALYASAASLVIDHVDVSGFQYGAYCDTGSSVSIGAGVHMHDNHNGLFVADGGTSSGGSAVVSVPAAGDATDFNTNDTGIVCRGNGSLQISGPPANATQGGLISTDNNGGSGVFWGSSLAKPVGSISGLEATGNGTDATQPNSDGLFVYAHSVIQIRNSYFHGNIGNGLNISGLTPNTADGLSQIDLGMGIGANAGRNTFANNGLAGLCVGTTAATLATDFSLNADGNIFGTSGGDCTKSGKFTRASACTAGVDYAGACSDAASLNNCTTSTTCQ